MGEAAGIANVLGDANSTRGEAVICVGDIGQNGVRLDSDVNQQDGLITGVLVNGVLVPPNGSSPDNKLFRWNFLDNQPIIFQIISAYKFFGSAHTGSRNGFANTDAWRTGTGDPYGGLATIEWVVYSDLAQSNSPPDIRILATGPRVTKYAKIATYNNGLITLTAANADIAGNAPFTVQVLGNSLAARTAPSGSRAGLSALREQSPSQAAAPGPGPAGTSGT